MYRYGVLSTASIAARYIAGIRESKEGYVYGIASRNTETARKAAEQFGIEHYYGDYQSLIEDPNIDIVYIPSMNAIHYEWAKKALLQHKHVVVEKPFVIRPEEAEELFDLAEQMGCFLMEAQKAVFLPATLFLKEVLESGALGDLKYIELKAGFPGRFPADHWMNDLSLGGGALYGSATYTIEYLSFLFDEPQFTVKGEFIKGVHTADDVVSFHLLFNNLIAHSAISMCNAMKNEAVFYGTKGYAVVPNYWKSSSVSLVIDGEEKKYEFPFKSEFVYENNHLQECIAKGLTESPVMNRDKTITAVRLVEELYKSYKPL